MQNKQLPRKLAITTITLIILASPLFTLNATSFDQTTTNTYTQFVHTNYNTPQGNITYLDKPNFPIYLNDSQVPIGGNWTISCPLKADHNYRVFCYGKWASVTATQSTAKTDYDLFIYNPSGGLEASSTEAAGVTETITSGNSGLFKPQTSGNYTFLIKNDARESYGAEQATFMIIENIECNQWYTIPMEGKAADSTSKLETIQGYEFTTTNDTYVEVYIDVPNSLDMYEARLYLMTDANSPATSITQLPTESGLYGTQTGSVGGYNFDTNESSRGVSYASCSSRGQDMVLNYTSTSGTNHYYLVLMGEEGAGEVKLLIKTIFRDITLSQVGSVGKVYPNTPVDLKYVTDSSRLERANLNYTTNNWETSHYSSMIISGQTCNATIPSQAAGTTIQYNINAVDVVKNAMNASGTYAVKAQASVDITVASNAVYTEQNITVSGVMSPAGQDATVTLTFFSSQATQAVDCQVESDGTFTGSFAPTTAGDWAVLANAPETKSTWACDSPQYVITVKEMPLYQKYATYISVGLILALFIGGSIYFLKFNGK